MLFRSDSSSPFYCSCDVLLLGNFLHYYSRADHLFLFKHKKNFDHSHVELQAKPHDTLDLCILLNDNLAQTVHSYPRRFVGLGTLPMQAPDLAILEMRRCVKELGFPGVQIGSHINNWDLNAPELFPFYAVRPSVQLDTRLFLCQCLHFTGWTNEQSDIPL